VRIFVAGATGVLGRQVLPMLTALPEHVVHGMTRNRPDVVRQLGAEPVVVDVYDRERTIDALAKARPEVVVNLLTDLAARDFAANARMRRVGAGHLVEGAVLAKARRIVVESISFASSPESEAAVAEMERTAQASGLDAVIVRLARLWGPGTWHEAPETGSEYVHIREAARLVCHAVLGSP
jgi:nucleoside-diphosphate-sugar epimerase